MVAEIIFWTSILLLLYTYAGYPLLMWHLARRPRLVHRDLKDMPSVTILVVAYNEAQRIQEKILNLLQLEYREDGVNIVVASDGSTDNTAELCMPYRHRGVTVLEYGERRGKPSILNDVIPHLESDLVFLVDVRQRIDSTALRSMVQNFFDPQIGAVSGELMLDETGSEVGEGVGFYWRYEKFIRTSESCVGSTVGVTGAIYAIRKELFEPIPAETILDDVLIPMKIVTKGYRVLLESGAHAYDRVAQTADIEFMRKVRTIAGNFQLLFTEPWLLSPIANPIWFQTVSHKFLRLLGPFCLLAALMANLTLLSSEFYRLLFVLQVSFYGLAMAGVYLRHVGRGARIVNVAYSFCLLNWATLVGFCTFLTRAQQVTWQKSPA